MESPQFRDAENIDEAESRIDIMAAAAPDKKLTLFALRLALLDKAANGLGTLAFIWATVVLLGGFAVTLETVDFWFVSIILLIEGTRIFRLTNELKWQRETRLISVPSLRDDGIHAFDHHNLLKRTWYTWMVQFVSYSGWQLISKMVSFLLSCLQLLAALTCVVLSLNRLAKQDYGVVSGSDTKNRKSALNIFYALSLANALLYLLEKVYRHWKIIRGNLLREVNREYGFGFNEVGTVRLFFDETYSRCINRSILDGSKMELVSYSIELLQSGDGEVEQLWGARVLSKLAQNNRFKEQTLRAIGTMQDVVDRLIEMLNCKDHEHQELRRAAAEIIFNLVKIKCKKCIRLTGIAGYVESIESLLYDVKEIEIHSRQYGDRFMQSYHYWGFSLLGLKILESLADDHENCGKIGSSSRLLLKIISLTELKRNATDSQIRTVQQALRLLGNLVNTTGPTGKALRKEISEKVCAISNLRDVLQISTHDLKIVAIDTLKSLSLEEEGRKIVGRSSRVLQNLCSLSFMDINTLDDNETSELVAKAGELLALLSLENEPNCQSIMSVELQGHPNLAESLSTVLDDPVRGLFATKILRNLFAGLYFFSLRNKTVTAVQVVKFVMEKQGEHQEAAIGLAAQIFRSLSDLEFDHIFQDSSGLTKRALISELVKIFQRHLRPSNKVPSIRRLGIELLIALMEKDNAAMEMRKELWEALEGVMETTTEMENYSTFSGSMGLSSHRTPIQTLVNSAKEWLRDEHGANRQRLSYLISRRQGMVA